jgi:hypothetical protein
MPHLHNKGNEYQWALSDKLFSVCPKSVFAAIAVSSLTCGGDQINIAEKAVLNEWWVLFENGIVPQKPPFPRPNMEAK